LLICTSGKFFGGFNKHRAIGQGTWNNSWDRRVLDNPKKITTLVAYLTNLIIRDILSPREVAFMQERFNCAYRNSTQVTAYSFVV
jgi:hypothetical protein